jgi:hypothetical protein
MKVVLLGLLGNLAVFLLFAFGNWNINPECWDSVSRVFCTVLMGVDTLMTFTYFIIELSNKK